jgi:hypothetical protein
MDYEKVKREYVYSSFKKFGYDEKQAFTVIELGSSDTCN